MRKLIVTLIFLATTLVSIGQTLEWVSSYGSTTFDRIWDGEIYGNQIATVGTYSGPLSYNPSTTILSPVNNGGNDILLNIYDNLGQLLVSKGFGGSSSDIAKNLAYDNSGNIYMVGGFSNTVEFDRSRIGLFSKTSNGGQDAFLAKFDSNGNLIWVNTFGGTSNDEALSIAINSVNEVVITGYYQGTVDFDPDTTVQNFSSNNNSTDIFLSKFNSNGNLVWNKTFGSTSNNEASREVVIENNDNIILVGFYGGIMDIDPSSAVFNLAHGSQEDSFISKFDNQGSFIFAKSLSSSSELIIKSVKISSLNEIIVAGSFLNSADFDPSSSSTVLASSNGGADMFLLKLDSNANFVFVKTLGSSGSDVMEKIELDAADNIFCTGYYFGSMDFDPSTNGTV
ncbi:MAG: mannose/fructose-specific phosphotransferase system component IIA, partial [Vicingaceae bacterium]